MRRVQIVHGSKFALEFDSSEDLTQAIAALKTTEIKKPGQWAFWPDPTRPTSLWGIPRKRP
jgi:hypothetical protein